MQKNLLQNEESLIKRLLETLRKNKKNLIRTMAGVSAAAMIATGAGCTESSQEDPYALENYKVKDYTSSVAVNLLENENVKELEKKYNDWHEENKVTGLDIYKMQEELQLQPLCYEFFKNYYGEETGKEKIQKNARIACQFVDEEGNLYVQYYFLNKTINIKNSEVAWMLGKYNVVLLKYNLPEDLKNDLINSGLSQNNVKNLVLLDYIVNNCDYEVLTKEISNDPTKNHNVNLINNGEYEPLQDKAVSSMADLQNKITYTYILINDDKEDSTKHSLYYVVKKMSERDLQYVSEVENEDFLEYPQIYASNSIAIYENNIPEDYIEISKKNVIFIGDYEDSAYWGVDYTWDKK